MAHRLPRIRAGRYSSAVIVRPRPAPEVLVEDLDDDVCLYRSDTNEVLVLNQSAGDVWRLADGELTVEEIAGRITEAYELPPGHVDADVRHIVADLAGRGYLVDESAQPASGT